MITLISSTNRKSSLTLTITKIYQDILRNKGAETTVIDLAHLPVDFLFTALYSHTGKNLEFNKFSALIEASEKFVFIVPEYNASFPGVLKAFLDGMKYPHSFTNKKAVLVGLSAGMMGGALALSHLTDIFNYLGMHVHPMKVRLAGVDKHMVENKITHKLYNELLDQQAEQLIKW